MTKLLSVWDQRYAVKPDAISIINGASKRRNYESDYEDYFYWIYHVPEYPLDK